MGSTCENALADGAYSIAHTKLIYHANQYFTP